MLHVAGAPASSYNRGNENVITARGRPAAISRDPGPARTKKLLYTFHAMLGKARRPPAISGPRSPARRAPKAPLYFPRDPGQSEAVRPGEAVGTVKPRAQLSGRHLNVRFMSHDQIP
jgi:hypothetical protein